VLWECRRLSQHRQSECAGMLLSPRVAQNSINLIVVLLNRNAIIVCGASMWKSALDY
jgi:hypothetical protein